MAQAEVADILQKARNYSSIKYKLIILDIIYIFALLFLFTALGISKILAGWLYLLTKNRFFVVPIYLGIILITYYLLDLPLNFYRSFILEHKFCLSQQKIRDWLLDQFKSGIIAYVISLILLGSFYYIFGHYAKTWWLIVSIFWISFSMIMARLVPIIIIPMFFKYNLLADKNLRERIINLASKMKVRILDVFEIDFSKKTLKANAAFVGWGATRRVILADTLKDKYSYDEIEVILAHEFAHYRLRHLLKLILINSLVTMLTFYLIFITSDYALIFFGFSSLSEVAALPLILMYFFIFGIITQPFQCYVSRVLERNADIMALKVTGMKDAFISAMDKLASQNLSDRNPPRIIKFFFFDHPPIDERIALAK